MGIIRISHDKNNPYVLLNKKTLEISTLSWEAKGLWSYLLSKPDDWNVSVLHLTKNFGAGKAKLYRILKELIDHNLCRRHQPRYVNEKGKKSTGSMEYTVFESPFSEKKQLSENQEAGFQEATFRDALISKEELINNEKERESRNSKSSDDPPPLCQWTIDAIDLCEQLRKRIISHGVKVKDPKENTNTWKRWVGNMERLMRIDKRPYEEIKKIIDFSHDDEFWCQNILSPLKLREKYDQLAIQRKFTRKNKITTRIEENKKFAQKIREEIKERKSKLKFSLEFFSEYIEIKDKEHPYTLVIRFIDTDFKERLEHELSKRKK